MSQITPDSMVKVFPLIIGSLFILLALFNQPLLHLMGLRPLSELFTTPRFQSSARITEKLGRLLLAFIGVGFLSAGVGALFLSGEAAQVLTIAVGVLSALILLAIVGTVLLNWRA